MSGNNFIDTNNNVNLTNSQFESHQYNEEIDDNQIDYKSREEGEHVDQIEEDEGYVDEEDEEDGELDKKGKIPNHLVPQIVNKALQVVKNMDTHNSVSNRTRSATGAIPKRKYPAQEEEEEEEDSAISAMDKLKQKNTFGSLVKDKLNLDFNNSLTRQISFNIQQVEVWGMAEEPLMVGYSTTEMGIPRQCYPMVPDTKKLLQDVGLPVKGFMFIYRRHEPVQEVDDVWQNGTNYKQKKSSFLIPLEIGIPLLRARDAISKVMNICSKLLKDWKSCNDAENSGMKSIPMIDDVFFEMKTNNRKWTFAYILQASLMKYMSSESYDNREMPTLNNVQIHLKLASNLPNARKAGMVSKAESFKSPQGNDLYRSKAGYFSSANEFISMLQDCNVQNLLEKACRELEIPDPLLN